jgi:hypothetical protein
VLPVFVIAPSRRFSPVESSLGVSPRNGARLCGRNLVQSPSSTLNASAVKRRDAAQTDKPAHGLDERRCRRELRDRLVECVPTRRDLQHRRVAIVESKRERPAVEPLPA